MERSRDGAVGDQRVHTKAQGPLANANCASSTSSAGLSLTTRSGGPGGAAWWAIAVRTAGRFSAARGVDSGGGLPSAVSEASAGAASGGFAGGFAVAIAEAGGTPGVFITAGVADRAPALVTTRAATEMASTTPMIESSTVRPILRRGMMNSEVPEGPP